MNTLLRYDPAREFVTLRDAMNRLFEDSFVSGYAMRRDGDGNGSAAEWRLPIDAYLTDDAFVVQAAVPGLKPDDVEITYEGDTVSIRGELPRPQEGVNHIYNERPWGRFSRTLRLNFPVDTQKAEALFENGLLTITLPKAESVRPKVIPIKTRK